MAAKIKTDVGFGGGEQHDFLLSPLAGAVDELITILEKQFADAILVIGIIINFLLRNRF